MVAVSYANSICIFQLKVKEGNLANCIGSLQKTQGNLKRVDAKGEGKENLNCSFHQARVESDMNLSSAIHDFFLKTNTRLKLDADYVLSDFPIDALKAPENQSRYDDFIISLLTDRSLTENFISFKKIFIYYIFYKLRYMHHATTYIYNLQWKCKADTAIFNPAFPKFQDKNAFLRNSQQIKDKKLHERKNPKAEKRNDNPASPFGKSSKFQKDSKISDSQHQRTPPAYQHPVCALLSPFPFFPSFPFASPFSILPLLFPFLPSAPLCSFNSEYRCSLNEISFFCICFFNLY